MSDSNGSGDSRELEALFDSIASGAASSGAEPPPAAPAKPSLMQQLREVEAEVDDSEELQALFEAVVAARGQGNAASAVESGEQGTGDDKVFRRVGQMARQLHDTLCARLPGRDFSYFLSQRGMFSYTGMQPAQVDRLREEHGVYLVRSGRMCVAGLNSGNVERTAQAMAAVLG